MGSPKAPHLRLWELEKKLQRKLDEAPFIGYARSWNDTTLTGNLEAANIPGISDILRRAILDVVVRVI